MGSNQVIGDIDIATNNYIIEVKKSIKSFKENQISKYININDKNFFNINNKHTILYIHEKIELTPININNIKKLKNIGVIVVNGLEELKGVLS